MAIIAKECLKGRYPYSTAKIQLVQHCAAISAIAEFFIRLGSGKQAETSSENVLTYVGQTPVIKVQN